MEGQEKFTYGGAGEVHIWRGSISSHMEGQHKFTYGGAA